MMSTVVFGEGVDALRPKQKVRGGDAEPELIVRNLKHRRVVDSAAALVAEKHISGLHRWLCAVRIVRNQQVHEVRRIGTLDLYPALDSHIPHADLLGQILILLEQPVVLGLDVCARVVHMVVGCVCQQSAAFDRRHHGDFLMRAAMSI